MRLPFIILLSCFLYSLHSSCARKPMDTASGHKSSIHGSWKLTHLRETKSSYKSEEEELKITIDTALMAISGYTGCNQLSGKIKRLSADDLKWGPIAATQRMCLNAHYENEFLMSLDKIVAFRVINHTLELLDDSGTTLLHFERL